MNGLKGLSAQTDSRRVVTILYADIVGSTKILNQLDPDDAAEFLDPVINSVIRAVHNFGGTVVRVQGDGVKAVFGANRSQEDHALRAVLCGDQIVNLVQNLPEQNNIPLADIRVGMHSGYVIVRWQHTDFGGGLDTVGSTAHIAAKVEAAAEPNRVWFTEATANLLPQGVQFRYIQDSEIETDDNEEKLYELVNIQAEHIAGTSNRNLTLPLIGRNPELDMLKPFIIPSRTNDQRLFSIAGIAGVGKSRLVNELVLIAVQKNVRTEIFNAPPVFTSTPYHFIANMAARLLDIERTTNVTEEMSYPWLSLDQQQFEALQHLLGPGQNRLASWDLYVNEKAATIDALMMKILDAVSNKTPLLLIIEDVHNIDSESLECLRNLSRYSSNLPLSIILTTRPQGITQTRRITDNLITLKPLDEKHTAILMLKFNQTKGNHKISKELFANIARRSGGLPLAVVELLKHKSLNQPGKKEARSASLELEPVFHSQLDMLDKNARKLMNFASVIGSETRAETLRRTLAWDKQRYNLTLKQVIEHGLLVAPAYGHIAFSHHLLHEISYGAMTRKNRQQIHAQVYESMRGEDEFTADILAYHAERAGKLEQALKHLWAACEQALAQAAYGTVMRLFRRAEYIMDRSKLTGNIYHVRFALMVFGAHHQLALQENLKELFETASHNPNIHLSHFEKVTLLANLAMIHWIGGRHEEGYKIAYKAVSLLKIDDSLQLTWLVQFVLANLEFAIGNATDSIDRLLLQTQKFNSNHEAIISTNSTSLGGVMVRVFAVWHMSAIEKWTDAEKILEEALYIAKSNNHVYSLALYNTAKGYFLMIHGDWERALPYLEKGYSLCQKHSFSGNSSYANCWYARALIASNQLDKAALILDEEKKSDGFKYVNTSSTYYYYNSQSHLNFNLGNIDKALAYSALAIEHAEKCPDPINLAHAKYEHAILLKALKGDSTDIYRHLNEAKKLAKECGMHGLVERCTWSLEQPEKV